MKECLVYFFKLGLLGFGGPLSILSQIQNDLVYKKKWIAPDDYLRALPWIKSLPGPVAFQSIVYFARMRAGPLVGILSGVVFILPSFLMMIFFAHFSKLTVEYPQINSFFLGAQAAALVLIFWALRDLTKTKVGELKFWLYSFIALILFFASLPEPIIILLVGAVSVLGGNMRRRGSLLTSFIGLELFLICLQAGAFSFGTGLSIIPLLEREFLQFVSKEEFLRAIALGQMTPGPVVITVTYLGYKVFGFSGALICTLGIFLPGAVNMLTWFPMVLRRLSTMPWITDFLLGALAAIAVGIVMALASLGHNLIPSQFLILLLVLIGGFFRKISGALWVGLAGLVHLVLW